MMSSLPTPFTDNQVTKVDNLVVKTGANVANEYAWYQAYKDKSDIPYVMGLKDNSIVMQYVERCGELNIDEVIELVEKYKNYEPLNELVFLTYQLRISRHLDNNRWITNGEKLKEKLFEINLSATFSHGDLSVNNIIPSNTGIKLIDPLYSDNIFGSYVIDYAKLAFSIKFYQNDVMKYNYLRAKLTEDHNDILNVLIASECVRVATYKKQFSFIAENLINEL